MGGVLRGVRMPKSATDSCLRVEQIRQSILDRRHDELHYAQHTKMAGQNIRRL